MKKFLVSSFLIIIFLASGCATMDWQCAQDCLSTPTWECFQNCATTNPIPTDPPPPPVDPGHEEQIIIADLDTIPDRMTAAGFPGSPNAQYYILAHVVAFGPGASIPEHPELTILSSQRAGIEIWWDTYIAAIRERMKTNPKATATAITNDGPDRCGFRLGPTIVERLSEFGDRVQLGTILPESEY